MFTIRHYETPNRYKFTELRSERTERIRKQRTSKRVMRVLTIIAVIVAIAVIGYVGEQDRQYELINAGYSAEEASK